MSSSLAETSIALILLVGAVYGQMTVDATVPTQKRHKEPMRGSFGSLGYKLPVKLVIATTTPPDNTGKSVVEFVLTNAGKEDIRLPISTNATGLEPANEHSYVLECLRLYISNDSNVSLAQQSETQLYGSEKFPATIVALSPGSSIRVLARINLAIGSNGTSTGAFVGHAVLNREAIEFVRGETVSNTREIGSTTSAAYAPQALLGATTR